MLRGKPYRCSWKALPIDGAADTWEKEFGCTRHSIGRALQALEKYAENQGTSLYQQIMQPKSKEFTEKNGRSTYPARMYWETKQIIMALTCVREELCGKEKSGNILADKTLYQLASDLLNEDLSGEQFVQTIFIANPRIRERIVESFQKQIAIRLEAIRVFTENKLTATAESDDYAEALTVRNILAVCQALDVLIGRLLYTPYTNKPNLQPATIKDFSILYESLVKERRRITTYGEIGDDIVTKPSLENTHENQEVIHQLNAALSNIKSAPSEQKSQRQLEIAFEKYLLATVPDSEKIRVKRFKETVSAINRFAQHANSFDDFRPAIKGILVAYAKDIFAGIKSGNPVLYAYDPYKPHSTDDMFLGEDIKNIQQNIVFRMHNALNCLYQTTVIFYYGINEISANKERLADLTSRLHSAMRDFAQDYPDLPLSELAVDINIPSAKFVDHYNEFVVPVLDSVRLNVSDIENQGRRMQSMGILGEIKAAEQMLWYVCEMVAVWEIEQTLIELRDKYESLASFYKKFTL